MDLSKKPLISPQALANVIPNASRHKVKAAARSLGIRLIFTPAGQQKLSFQQAERIAQHLGVEQAVLTLAGEVAKP